MGFLKRGINLIFSKTKEGNQVEMQIADMSLYLISKYIPLSDEESQAILYHDGRYIPKNRFIAHKECHLTLLLTFADTWTVVIFMRNEGELKIIRIIFRGNEMTVTNEKIDEILSDILDYICKNPLIFVSETDIHSLVMVELMKIPELKYTQLYPTNSTIGLSKQGKPSNTKYKTMAVHKEYGHHDIPRARSDIVILDPQEIAKIDDPPNLKVNKKWIEPDYIFEFGTEKAAGSESDFKDHLNNDIEKIKKSKKKGYVIHIQRNICKSRGVVLSKNKAKYEGYLNVIKQSIKGIDPKLKVLVIIVEIGNEGRGIWLNLKSVLPSQHPITEKYWIQSDRFKAILLT